MSREYAEGRIREALKLAKGNPTRARQRVMAWTFEDPKLLQALAQPHLTGIVAHAISRVVYKQETAEDEVPDLPESLDMAPETFGKEILAALQDSHTPMFGLESGAPTGRRGQASKNHIDAIKHIASQSGKNKEKKSDE